MNKLAINGGKPVRTKPFPGWPIFDEREIKAVTEVVKSGKWGRLAGNKVKEFEDQFAAYHDAKYAVCVTNGTAALEISLKAAGVGPGDEVIVPPYTFIATASTVLLNNAIPVFVDIEPDTCTLDPAKTEAAITARTKAIVPVWIGGGFPDIDRIMDIAGAHKLKVIADCAQAHGAEWNGKKAGAFADLTCFSFQASKNMSAGEGGIIVSNDENLLGRCYSYHNIGRLKGAGWYDHHLLGWNNRMTEFQAAILLVQLERLNEQTEKRAGNAQYLDEKLSRLSGISPIIRDARETRRSYHIYMFKYDTREFNGATRQRFIEALTAEGIPCSPGYPKPIYKNHAFLNLNRQSCPLGCRFYNGQMDYRKVKCPVAERACEEIVFFPQSGLLGARDDMDDIIRAVEKIQAGKNEL